MGERTLDDLRVKQALPLDVKISLTRERIRQWVHEYGEDGVYVSFSGGKDSTVLLDIVRNVCDYKSIPAVFVDVPTQYPELKQFVQTFDNVTILKPKISFAQVCEKYGFPIISKEVSESVAGARKYLKKVLTSLDESKNILTNERTNERTKLNYRYFYERVTGTGRYEKKGITPRVDEIAKLDSTRGGKITSTVNLEELANTLNERMLKKQGGNNQRLAIMLGMLTKDKKNPIKANIPERDRSQFNMTKYQFFLEAPFEISNRCCNVMKKDPLHRYAKETGRHPITAQMADESRLRTQKWIQHGCNAFDCNNPISNPMSFWTEQDVLQYIVENGLKICSVYGEVVEDYGDELEGQMSLEDYGLYEKQKKLKCSGCQRTGCICCSYGAHLESKEESRFLRLKETHPKFYNLLDVLKNNGVTYREAIEWTNQHLKRGHIWI